MNVQLHRIIYRLEFDNELRVKKIPGHCPRLAAHMEKVILVFALAPEVRRIFYTTNAIASLHSQV